MVGGGVGGGLSSNSSGGGSGPSSLTQIMNAHNAHGGSGANIVLIGDNNNVLEDNNYGILRTRPTLGTASITTTTQYLEHHQSPQHRQPLSQQQPPALPPSAHYWIPTGERRRRRLPEIPKSKRGWPPNKKYTKYQYHTFCLFFFLFLCLI